jgi:8-oxo-dGTP pyrophosphatase MutT (NUDIX family)
MPQKYKVYFANRPVVFTNDEELLALQHGLGSAGEYEVIVSQGITDTMLIESAINRGAKMIYLKCRDVEWSWQQFSSQFVVIRAAGGVVSNEHDEVLFIHRLEKWDLPKGKVEEGEELELAALREVEEECSITKLELKHHLITTYHTYSMKGEQVLKSTDWYVMKHQGNEVPQPQIIEGITEARWIAQRDWGLVHSNTFPSVIDVLHSYASSR